eukprot:2062737-Karenia_brevis.AAC.1
MMMMMMMVMTMMMMMIIILMTTATTMTRTIMAMGRQSIPCSSIGCKTLSRKSTLTWTVRYC